MSEQSKPGGRRAGQGRPTEHQTEQKGKRQADLRVQQALERLPDETIDAFVQSLVRGATSGDGAAQKLLLEHLKGRAATQAPITPDTTINVIGSGIPRPWDATGKRAYAELYQALPPGAKPVLMEWMRKWTASGRRES